jgi:A/G-specific adenine glycosylase
VAGPDEPPPRTERAIRRRLLAWYDAAHRDFPWRGTRDPYAVLVSEVMLQQTQASRIAVRFPRFLARFPSAAALAAAPPDAVLGEWSGLGYNRRALALRDAAAAVVSTGWPSDVPALERLPGVGPYTARAVASLAFGQRVGVVDTNVRRWLLRRLSVTDAPRSLQAASDALALAGPDRRAADWTHASMEFGASVCRPRVPQCHVCPIARGCPSRGRRVEVAVPRQPALAGSTRAYRGSIVRLLGVSPQHALPADELRRRMDAEALGPRLDDDAWDAVVVGLARDRLVHRSGEIVRLGAATIGQ